jgi:multidrug efflux pump subunit AcrB
MNIAGFAVRNRPFTIVAFLGLTAVGAFSLATIPKMEDPPSLGNTYSVVAIYPGASPNDIEQLVIDPIERRVRELGDVKSIKTTIEDGVAVANVEVNTDVDPAKKYDDLVREIGALRQELPRDLYRLDIYRWDVSEVALIQLALVSNTAPYAALDAQARRLKDRLSRVSGVKKAMVFGIPQREVRIGIDLGRAAAFGVPLGQIMAAVQTDNINVPGGGIELGGRRFNVRTSGNYRSLDELRATVVGGSAARVVRLGDLADVAWGYAEQSHLTRINGRRAAFVVAMARPGTNVMTVRDALMREADGFANDLPETMRLERGFDQAANVQARLGKLGFDFGLAILLVLVTLLPLGLRAAAIVMVSIPLSLAIGMTLLKATGFTVNQLTIVGMVIALGLLVDDSIVVIENIARWMRDGRSRVEAAVAGTGQITKAVLGCTATLVFAFVPIVMLPGSAGTFVRSLPMAVIFTILASLLVSLTIIPFLAAWLLRDEGSHQNIFLRALNRLIDVSYGKWLHAALARPRTTVVAALAVFLVSLTLVPVIGFSLFPKAGIPQYLVEIDTPDGSSLASTDSVVRFVEQALIGRPEVRTVLSNSGRSNPLIYYNVLPRYERPNVGELFVLTNGLPPKQTALVLDSLRTRFEAYPGARIKLREFEQGLPLDAPIAVRVIGPDQDTLRALAARVEARMKEVEGTRQVWNPLRLPRTDLRVYVDPTKAGMLGVPPIEVDRTVRLALAGLPLGRYRAQDGQDYDLTIRLPRGEVATLSTLSGVQVPTLTGAAVPLAQVADLRFETSPALIQHYQAERNALLTSDVRTGYNTDRVTKAVLARLDSLPFPPGYRLQAAGEIESREESFSGLGFAALVSIFGILAILVLEFGSFRGTLIVASVIPLGIVGGLVALYLTNYTLSFMAFVGFIALIGIEIKNSILLVDFTDQLRREGLSVDAAVEQAGAVRFLPIVLTTLTAIGGLMPLALEGSGLYSPLAAVMIGGLISSTLLARLVTPVMYKLLPPAIAVDAAYRGTH